ncbi:MAG: YfiT family bacillithiol transferase [Gemmatimonadaceae bacterium]
MRLRLDEKEAGTGGAVNVYHRRRSHKLRAPPLGMAITCRPRPSKRTFTLQEGHPAMPDENLKYPIGRFAKPTSHSAESRAAGISVIEAAPAALRAAVSGLSVAQLDTPYRPGGWTVRQVVHHVPDSHLNAYMRLKLALTEERPVIKPYDEAAWALLEDSRSTKIETSLALLDAVHDRWVRILRAMSPDDFSRRWVHPESGDHDLDALVGLYAWHGAHHTAHVTSLRARNGW